MRRRCFLALLCSCCFLLSVIFSATALGIDADAVETVAKMEAATGRSFFGDSIPFTYKHNDVLYSGTLQYAGNISGTYRGSNIDSNSVMDSQVTVNSYDCIMYKASTNAGQFGFIHDVVVDCPVYYSEYARGGFGMSSPVSTSNVTDISNSIVQYPDNYVGSFVGICANTQASSSFADYYAVITTDDYEGYAWSWRPLLYEVSNGVYFEDIHFDNVLCTYYGEIYFCIWLPYVGGTMTDRPPVSETTTTGTTASGTTNTSVNVNVNVDIDMDETNGLLSQIKQGIDGIVTGIINGLKSLFIPSDDFMDDFTDDMEDLLSVHLGGLYEAEELIVDAFEELPNVTAKSEIYVEPVNIPVGETSIPLGGWHVPLKVSGLPSLLYDGIAFIIDFLCLAAFLRMCRNKLEIFLNPDSEVIQS